MVADNDSSAAATLVYAPLLTCAMWALPLLQTPSSTSDEPAVFEAIAPPSSFNVESDFGLYIACFPGLIALIFTLQSEY